MPWFAEIIVKLRERDDQGTRAIVETDDDGTILRAGSAFTALDPLITSNRTLRQSFPAASERLRAAGLLGPGPTMRAGLDTFLRIRILATETDAEIASLVTAAEAASEVEYAIRAAPIARAQSDLRPEQKYLEPACVDPAVAADECSGGVDALYAWKVAGGDGSGVRVCLCEEAFCADSSGQPLHADLPAVTLPVALSGGASISARWHGTMSLGVLAARDDTDADGLPLGTTGICHGASEIIFSTTDAGDDVAIDRVIGGTGAPTAFSPLGAGDVLVLNFVFDREDAGYSGGPALCPAEVSPPVLTAIQAAATLGVTVLQAAGNERDELVTVYASSTSTRKVWEPDETSVDFEDSLGVIVGAGVPGTSADRHAFHATLVGTHWSGSNYGSRVDCQGWGDEVATTVSEVDDLSGDYTLLLEDGDNSYVANYRDTSAATPMIAGVVACLQGAALAAGAALDPVEIRALLRDPANGSPQRDRKDFAAADWPVGPLPNLFKLLAAIGIAPDFYCRDTLADDGARGPAFTRQMRSPDLILRGLPSSDPEGDFGAAHWTEDGFIQQAVPGKDAQIYVRAANRGNAPDFATARVYWTEPAPYVHPRDYRLLGSASLEEVDGGELGVTGKVAWSGSSVPDPPHYGLVAELQSERRPVAFPGPHSGGALPHLFASHHNEIAVRNVQEESTSPGGTVRFSMNLRGVPGLGIPRFVYRIRPDLPRGAKTTIRSSAAVTVIGSSGSPVTALSPASPLIVHGPSPFDLGPVVLASTDRIRLTVDIDVPSDAPGRAYTSFVEQMRAGEVYGRITFVLNVK